MGAFGAPFVKTFCGKNILTDSLTAPVIDGEPIIFVFCSIFSISVAANISGALLISSNNSEAKLVVNEALVDGDLSQFFDQIKIIPSDNGSAKKKSYQMSNDRFSFVCNKAYLTSAPSTSCTFVIKAGLNDNNISTFIFKGATSKVATIGLSKTLSKELEDIFPAIGNNSISYLLKTDNGLILEASGATWGNLSIGFADQQP